MNRRNFLSKSGVAVLGASLLPQTLLASGNTMLESGVQLYTFRDEMMKDALGTLKRIADLGIKQIETARSNKGHYYGYKPHEMKRICSDLGMELSSGHIALDKDYDKTLEEAVLSGQEYVICSSMPTRGHTIGNYKSVAEAFNKAGEKAKNVGLKFGYHNHASQFKTVEGQVLYDVLMDNTEPDLVHMELDLGWVIMAGKDPIDYFKKYPGRFPLWHLKDMSLSKKHSVEFGKGGLDIQAMFNHRKASGLKHYYIEQEEYTLNPFDSMKHNMNFLNKVYY